MKKTVIITGANSGLGFETARKIASDDGFKVILACRNREKALSAQEIIIAETGNPDIGFISIDTSSLASVRACAEQVIASGEKVYALVNNAGISPMGNIGTTEDGFELVFATNYLGHFLLTHLLLPHMEDGGKIFNISSDMHNPPGGMTWPGTEVVAHGNDDRHRYSWSKLCMIYFTHSLSGMLSEQGREITVNAFNPGFMADTNFSKGTGKMRELAIRTAMPERYGKLETSSDALALLVKDPQLPGVTGAYFDRSTHTIPSSDLSYNAQNAEELWRMSKTFTGLD